MMCSHIDYPTFAVSGLVGWLIGCDFTSHSAIFQLYNSCPVSKF